VVEGAGPNFAAYAPDAPGCIRVTGVTIDEVTATPREAIGQGFADQLFRGWTRDNPSSRLIPVNANPAILAMIAAVRLDESPRDE
jgi:predicted RNase H-like HicB family nuclease